MSRPSEDIAPEPVAAYVVQPAIRSGFSGRRTPEAMLEEAEALALAISNLQIKGSRICSLSKISPAHLIGKGQVEEIAKCVEDNKIILVFINHSLTPPQQRNLEKELKAKVIDRTGLILEIFGERAQTREGQLQVELAALTYQRSRLVRSWTHLERQRGGFGFLGGPGESQLEMDRRLIGDRIIKIKKELGEVRRTRGLHRTAREKAETPVIALVGYTNAGKSTLFNRLTQADVFVKDLLFATLDPTMRTTKLPSGRTIIFSDTVGFISDLPTHLVESFRATLEEVENADLILHVRDISHLDTRAQKEDVEGVLETMHIDRHDPRLIEVLNKIDLLPEDERHLTEQHAARLGSESAAAWELGGDKPVKGVAAVSAVTGEGVDGLLALINDRLEIGQEIRTIKVKYGEGASLAWLHEHGRVISRKHGIRHVELQVMLSKPDWGRFHAQFDKR